MFQKRCSTIYFNFLDSNLSSNYSNVSNSFKSWHLVDSFYAPAAGFHRASRWCSRSRSLGPAAALGRPTASGTPGPCSARQASLLKGVRNSYVPSQPGWERETNFALEHQHKYFPNLSFSFLDRKLQFVNVSETLLVSAKVVDTYRERNFIHL